MTITPDQLLRAERISPSPIVAADSVPGYGPVFNAGLLHHDDRYHLFARAVRSGYRRNPGEGPRFLDYYSDILVFSSPDGARYEFDYVLIRATGTTMAFEDPRVQWVHSDGAPHLVMTYTRLPEAASGDPWRIGAHRLTYDDGRFVLDETSATLLGPPGIANKDAVLFNLADGSVAMIHRIHPDVQIARFDSLAHLWSSGADYWSEYLAVLDDHVIITPSHAAVGVGAGAPPFATPHGMVLVFHEREASGRYTAKVAVLDPRDGRVRTILDEPILVPELEWERVGDVDNVVFVQGAHLRDDGTVYLTYGAADRCVGAATLDLASLLGRVTKL